MPPPNRNQVHIDQQRNLIAGLKNAFEDPNHLANRKSSPLAVCEPVATSRSTRTEFAESRPASLPSVQQEEVGDKYRQRGFGSNMDVHNTVMNFSLIGNEKNELSVLNVNMNANGVKPKPMPKPRPKPKPILKPPNGRADKPPVKPRVKPKPTNIPVSPFPRKHSAESLNDNENTSPSMINSSEVGKSNQRSLQRKPHVQSRWRKVDPGTRPPVPYKPVYLKSASQDNISEQTSRNEFSKSTGNEVSINSEHKNSEFTGESHRSTDNSNSSGVYVKSLPSRTEAEHILGKQQSREESVEERKRRNLEAIYQYQNNIQLSGNSGENEHQIILVGKGRPQVPQQISEAARDKDNKPKNKLPQKNLSPGDKQSNLKTKLNLKDLGKNVRKNFQKRFSDEEILSGDELEKENGDFECQVSGMKKQSWDEASSPVRGRCEHQSEEVSDESGMKKKNKKIHHKLKKFRQNFQKKFTADEVQPEPAGEAINYEDGGSGGSFHDYSEFDDDDDYFSDLEEQEAPSEDGLEEQNSGAFHSVKPPQKRISYENTDTDAFKTDKISSITMETYPHGGKNKVNDAEALGHSSKDEVGQKTGNLEPYDSVTYHTTSISRSFEKLDEGIYHDCQDDVFPGPDGFDDNPQVRCMDNFDSYDKFSGGGVGEGGTDMNHDNDSDSNASADYEDVPNEDEIDWIQAETDDDSNRETHVPPVWDCSSSEEVVQDIPGQERTQEETMGDDEMSGEGIYHCAWSDDPPGIMEHLYDETPATAVGKRHKYTPVNKAKAKANSDETGPPEPTFVISENVTEELEGRFGVFSMEQRGMNDDEDDDAASVDSFDSGGVAHSEENLLDSNRAKSTSGRYTQDGSRGAIFSFSSNPTEMTESPDGSSEFDRMSPDFMKRGPKLPSPMGPIPAKRTNVASSPHRSDYESGVTHKDTEMDMSGSQRRASEVPFYQVYDEGVKRKESLLLIGPKGLAKRRQIIQDSWANQEDYVREGSGGSGGSAASQYSEDQGPAEDYYDRWYMEEELGLIVDGKEVMEDLYEPLDYEDYLESKRKKLFPLWRDQDEVKQSGLLQELSTQEQELQEALYEIITSEESYLKSLNLVITHFMESPELKECFQPQEHHTLFSNIATVRNVSQGLFDDLIAYHGNSLLLDEIPNVLLSHMSAMNCYVHYCANNQHQVTLMEQLKKKPHSKAVIQALEKHPDCQLLDLMSFLILPFQRITRLPLLVKAVLDRAHGEVATTADAALQAMTELAQRCNDEARRMEQIKDLHQIATSLVYKDGVKHLELSQKAILKKRGIVSLVVCDVAKFGKKKIVIKQRTIVVTSEKVILAKERVKGDVKRLEVQDWCMSNRVYVEEISEGRKKEMFPSGLPSEAVCVITVTFLENNQKCKAEYILCTSSESEKERWLQVLSTSSTGEMGEKIYDEFDCPEVVCIRPYRPRDMDELRLDLSDRIDVLTKIDDGWWQGKRLRDGVIGWFPESHVQEIENEHMRARRLKELHMRKRLSKEDFKLGSISYNPITISKHH
ncbi:Rho guanine nucleotide exchange factor 26 [Holothuria leucospilota]|uniref:Rho guanine nucleotide exchange factor 26 n=1 Tax=Holothuria leucospilota TaxID=206669 RepID=A0A9Q0YF90_HOLLE|nr:Rho guanine nucleotide exchange factor 26 [Holothuria leucospilota]